VKSVEFAPAARAELDAAADWYELERPGRGQRFYAAVERAVQLIAAVAHMRRRPGYWRHRIR
jgi:plasmid stabilization system protein ParE